MTKVLREIFKVGRKEKYSKDSEDGLELIGLDVCQEIMNWVINNRSSELKMEPYICREELFRRRYLVFIVCFKGDGEEPIISRQGFLIDRTRESLYHLAFSDIDLEDAVEKTLKGFDYYQNYKKTLAEALRVDENK